MSHTDIPNDEAKQSQHETLLQCAERFGGKNFFLQLLEAIRETKPHPLIAANKRFDMPRGTIRWNKVIFNDKLQLLFTARTQEGKRKNFLPDPGEKQYKKILNLVRTLHPIVFEIRPNDAADGEGFTVHPFDIIDENTTRINPVFDALFFSSVETVKKTLNYVPREN